MTTSFSRTREQIANLVLGKLGAKDNGASIGSADADIVYEAIDLRLKEMHALGTFWRKVTPRPLSFSLTANINSASATADIVFPIDMHVVNGSVDMPVDLISIREYAAISNKAATGVPEKALYDGGASFIFWPVPATSTTAKLVYQKYASDTAASTAPDVDVSMMRSLKDIVTFDCADHWGKSEQQIARWEKDAMLADRRIKNLSAQHVDVTAVAVDDFSTRGTCDYD